MKNLSMALKIQVHVGSLFEMSLTRVENISEYVSKKWDFPSNFPTSTQVVKRDFEFDRVLFHVIVPYSSSKLVDQTG